MVTVKPAAEPPGYNTSGELICANGGVLFSNNVSVPNDTLCNLTAQWTKSDDVVCYTGKVMFFKQIRKILENIFDSEITSKI